MFSEVAFRAQLVAQEQELNELRGSVKELKHQVKSKDRMVSELQKLKEIITSQDEQVEYYGLLDLHVYNLVTQSKLCVHVGMLLDVTKCLIVFHI